VAQDRVQWRTFVKTLINLREFLDQPNMELGFCDRSCRKHLVFAECESLVRISKHLKDGSSVVGGSAGPCDRENRQPLCRWPSQPTGETHRHFQYASLQGIKCTKCFFIIKQKKNSENVRGATQKFGEFEFHARTGCGMVCRR
jgi:hypothetical protein